ncbi:MAG: hypothetical protein U0324_39955 [Polyangiales bacterium]
MTRSIAASLAFVTLSFAAGCSDSSATPDASTDVAADAPALAPRTIALSPMGHDRFYGVTYDSRGNIYAVGPVADSTAATADQRSVVARFTPDGQLDTSFGQMGVASVNMVVGATGEVARGVVVQPSGKVVIAGTVDVPGAMDARDRNVGLARFNADGSVDTSFGTNGVVTLDLSAGEVVGTAYVADGFWGLAVYPDGRLLVTGSQKRTGGTDSDFAVLRLTVDGARDAAFASNGVYTLDINNRDGTPRTSSILPDGSTITSGYMTESDVVRPVVFKLTPAGAPDRAFGANGVFSQPVLAAATEVYAIALQGANLVTAGYGRGAATESLDWLSLRLTPAGAIDPSYGTMGYARIDLNGFNDNARTVAVLPDSRVLLVGGGRPAETNSDAMLGVLTANGARDPSFGTNGLRTFDLGGASDFFWGVAVAPSGRQAAVVGAKGVGTGAGNDDAAILLLPL